ncbi:MAG: hypothetical protein QNK05_10390 [Myxococcota bacterium]|nr:hypothetical protein [Myxococcota bacterium]
MSDRSVLLVDVGLSDMEAVADALRAMGYRTQRAKSVDEALDVLSDRRFAVGAAIVPPDLPALDLERALLAFRGARSGDSEAEPLTILVFGHRPDAERCARLREAGVELALWKPLPPTTLRFQVNRALANPDASDIRRRATRVPTDLRVQLRVGSREKPAQAYTLSPVGAYLATARPTLPRALVHVGIELPSERMVVPARVVMTNVPGNLERSNLPAGMGVRFTGHSPAAFDRLAAFAEERCQELVV